MIELEPCPFCGGQPKLFGREIRDYVGGIWAKETRREYWVQPFCWPVCILGNTHSHAFGVVGGIEYNTPEAAAEAWNRRADIGTTDISR